MRYIFTVLGMMIFMVSFSQSNFGFVNATITFKRGDSIPCLIKREISYGDIIVYKMHEDASEKEIASKDIKSIRLPFSFLENIQIDNKEKFSSLVVTGEINLYTYVELQEGETVKMPNTNGGYYTPGKTIVHYIIKNTGGYKEIKKENFLENILPLINDCPGLIYKIDNQQYIFEDMPLVIKEYNLCKT